MKAADTADLSVSSSVPLEILAEAEKQGPAPAPGIYFNVRFGDYLRWVWDSQSELKECDKSPAHYLATREGRAERVPTDDMIQGSALHTAFLEPELMPKQVACWTGGRRYGKEWDLFCDAHEGKYILTQGMHERLVGMVRALRAHPFVREWVGSMEATEVAAVGLVHGLMMKGRADALTADPLVDLKKVRSTDPAVVTSTVLGFGYHVQAWIYRELFDRERFVILCVEGSEPYDVVPFELSPAFLRAGEEKAKRLIDRVQECKASGEFPGRSDEIVTLEPPEWLADGSAITFGDTGVFDDDDPF